MLPDQMRRPAQVSQKRPVLDLDNRADDSEEVENNQSRDDQRDRPDDDEHYHEQVRPDETAPRQGPGYMPDRGALGSVLGARSRSRAGTGIPTGTPPPGCSRWRS